MVTGIKNSNRKGLVKKQVPVGEIILLVLAGATLLTVAAVAPGVIYALNRFGIDKKLLTRKKYYINDSLDRLIKKDFVIIIEKDGKKFAQLTEEGKKSLFRIQAKVLANKVPKKWDGKYRVVIFDIKENERFVRDEIRFTLLQCGFIKLQNSVWIYPYPCEGIIHLLRAHLEANKEDLVYMTVDSIENDSWIRKHFKLPSK